MLIYKNIETPIGTLSIVCDKDSLVAVEFSEDFLTKNKDKTYSYDPNHAVCVNAEKQLVEYFQGERIEFTIPLNLKGTEFQVDVWEALKSIPYGCVKSYKDIAVEIKRPLAVRAVGQANRRNPLPIVIPCHRVIGKNKDLVGYAGDKVGMKEQLLRLEGALL